MDVQTVARLTLGVDENRDHIQGPVDAPIVLVEYGDYECSFCGRADVIVQELQRHLQKDICYVYRHLPIKSAHPHAQLAAEAAEAAAAQGGFWEMHHKLFENQDALEVNDLIRYAGEIGLDVDLFSKELQEGRYSERVREDFLSGIRSGANATPTFFVNGERYDGAWDLESLLEAIEKPLGRRVKLLAQEFTRIEASGGIILLLATLTALFWANSAWAAQYFSLWSTELGFEFGSFHLVEHLLEWVNDGLMVIFFFVVGLEIKREFLTGELANPKKAALPIAAAVGGMVVPALFYLAFNAGGPGEPGWGIPMATDIAFTLGILTVLGKRIPLSLKVFFTAMAIVDDLGAVLVIALFYTAEIHWEGLVAGGVILLLLLGLNRARIYSTIPYGVLGIGLWLAFLESGVHPTLAGVLLALTIPTRSPANIRLLLGQVTSLLQKFDVPPQWQSQVNSSRQATISTLKTISSRMQSPAQRLESELHPWSIYAILPIFALANAGLALRGNTQIDLLHPISLGIVFGLVLGKPIGLTVFSWLAVRLGVAELPAGVNWTQLFGASWLAGIGFTISLFISGSAFTDPGLQTSAKLAILIASLIAALMGTGLLYMTTTRLGQSTLEAVPAGD